MRPGAVYWVKVRAFNVAGESADSPVVKVRLNATEARLAPPYGLRATAVEERSVVLAWEDPSGGTRGFRVVQSEDGGVTWRRVGLTPAGRTVFRATGLTPGQRYHFMVNASHGRDYSDYSTVLELRTKEPLKGEGPQVSPTAATIDKR